MGVQMIKRIWGPLLLAFALCLAGCSIKSKNQKGIVRFNLGDEPHSLDPRIARDPQSQMLVRMLFEGLTRIGPSDQPELAVASSLQLSEDLTTYTFTLRECFWSNGDRVKASDFTYAWNSLLDPASPSDQGYQLYMIKNAKAVKEGILPADSLGVHAVQDNILVVELEHPVPYFLELIAAPFFSPVHSLTDQANPRWAERPETYISNGPFTLESWHHHDQISVRRSKNYWDKSVVSLEGLDLFMVENDTALHLFEKGEIHWTGSPIGVIPVDALAHLKETVGISSKPRAETAFLRANTELRALSDPRVRKALALAIDRQAIAEHVLQAGQLPAQSLIPPSMQLSDQPYFDDHNPEKAKELLNQALSDSIKDRHLEELTLTYIQSERTHLVVQALQQQWNRAFGFQVNLEGVERKVYFDRIKKRDYDLAFCSWGADFHDPINFLEVFKYKDQSTNNTGWENGTYVSLLNASSQIQDASERNSLLKRCEEILMEEMPIIPIFFYSMVYMQDPSLSGVVFSSLGNLDFKWAQLHNAN